MFFTKNLQNKASEILKTAEQKNLKIAIAESCTGGLLSALFTDIEGSSKVFDRAFITYSNQAKIEMLQVKKELLDKYGAVSGEVAVSMAQGVIKNSTADISIAITGIAGPEGGSLEKPVGLVYISILNRKCPQRIIVRKFNFSGDRNEVRKSSIIEALEAIKLIITADR